MRFEVGAEGEDEGADLVADFAVVGEGFFFGARVGGEAGRIFEGSVEDAGAGDDGAGFVGGIADGDDEVWRGWIGDGFGSVMRDIDACFGHGADGEGIEAVWVRAGGGGRFLLRGLLINDCTLVFAVLLDGLSRPNFRILVSELGH